MHQFSGKRLWATAVIAVSVVLIPSAAVPNARSSRLKRPSAPTPRYAVTQLPAGVSPTLNNRGQIAMRAQEGQVYRITLFHPSTPNSPEGDWVGLGEGAEFPGDINNFGQVVGTDGNSNLLLWTPTSPNGTSGSWVEIFHATTERAWGAGRLNDQGKVAFDTIEIINNKAEYAYYLWEPGAPNGLSGTVRSLGRIPRGKTSYLTGLNADSRLSLIIQTEAWVWDASGGGQAVQQLLPFDGTVTGYDGGINAAGAVIGAGQPTGDFRNHALLWESGGSDATDLPALLDTRDRTALAVNSTGIVVGQAGDSQFVEHGALWQKDGSGDYQLQQEADEQMRAAIGDPATAAPIKFIDINDSGQLIGLALVGGFQPPYLLTPAGPPPPVEVFDANVEYTGGVQLPSLPDSDLTMLGGDAWAAQARRVSKAAADGVTLLLVRYRLGESTPGPVRVRVSSPDVGAPTGSLWPVDSQTLVDATTPGGLRDTQQEGPTEIEVSRGAQSGPRTAIALYRAPRDFDTPNGVGTANRLSRLIHIRVGLASGDPADDGEAEIVLVRPLVLLQHGTFSNPATWSGSFHLWMDGLQKPEVGHAYAYREGVQNPKPFYVARTSFVTVENSAGPVEENADVVLPQVIDYIRGWRESIGAAATQADVVTHSYGGMTMRVVAQRNGGPGTMLSISEASFRRLHNWGHGYFHKLITLACTHRGSAMTNHAAWLNKNGHTPGLANTLAIKAGLPMDKGAMRDQFVLSPAVRGLRETALPCHAFVGSGWLTPYLGFTGESVPYVADYGLDKPGGPYRSAGLPVFPGLPLLPNYLSLLHQTNYHYNLDYEASSENGLSPNYDLTVSYRSSCGLLSKPFISDITDLGQPGQPDLSGKVSHLLQSNNGLVSDRVEFLLQQSTTGGYFTHFPAYTEDSSPVEQRLGDTLVYDPEWLNIKEPQERRAALGPELVSDDPDGEVCPGQQLTLTLSWPGMTVAYAVLVWRSTAPDRGDNLLGSGQSSLPFTVPDADAGDFGVAALVTSTDGRTAVAGLTLEICDPGTYDQVACEPSPILLRNTRLYRPALFGHVQGGDWAFIGNSRHTTLASDNPAVVQVLPDRSVIPMNFGSTTLRVTARGGVTGSVPVTVDGVAVPVKPTFKGKLARTSKVPVGFAFLSSTGFDARLVSPVTVRVGGLPPRQVRGKLGTLKDVNGDRLQDLIVYVRPRDLQLARGVSRVPMLAAMTGGSLVGGSVKVSAR